MFILVSANTPDASKLTRDYWSLYNVSTWSKATTDYTSVQSNVLGRSILTHNNWAS